MSSRRPTSIPTESVTCIPRVLLMNVHWMHRTPHDAFTVEAGREVPTLTVTDSFMREAWEVPFPHFSGPGRISQGVLGGVETSG